MNPAEKRAAVLALTDHIAQAAQTGDQYVYAAVHRAVQADLAILIPDLPPKPKIEDYGHHGPGQN